MKLNIIEKVIIAIISLGILTIFIVKMYLEKGHIRDMKTENFENRGQKKNSDEKKKLEEDYQSLEYEPYQKVEGFRSNPKIVEGLDIGKEIIKSLSKPFKPVIDFFAKVKKAFEDIPKRAKRFGNAFKYVGDGIKLEFVNLGKSLDLGFNDLFDVVGTLGGCSITYLKNFRSCIIWYIFDCIGTTLYAAFVELPVFVILQLSGIKLQPMVDMIHCFINEMDAICYKYTCFHFIHFPDWVIRDCYSCHFQDKVDKLAKDWTKTIPDLLNEPAKKFAQAKSNFEASFSGNP